MSFLGSCSPIDPGDGLGKGHDPLFISSLKLSHVTVSHAMTIPNFPFHYLKDQHYDLAARFKPKGRSAPVPTDKPSVKLTIK